MIFAQQHYLPVRGNQTGEFQQLGTVADAVKGHNMRIVAKGIHLTDKTDENKTLFLNYSKAVIKWIKEGLVTHENLGHLLVWQAKYKTTDDNGKEVEETRLKITLRQGDNGEALDGDAFGTVATSKAIVPKTGNLAEFKLPTLIA